MRERVVAAANSRHPRSSARFFRFSTQRFLAASRRMPHNSIIAQQRQLYRDLLPRAAHTKVSNPEQAGPDFREVCLFGIAIARIASRLFRDPAAPHDLAGAQYQGAGARQAQRGHRSHRFYPPCRWYCCCSSSRARRRGLFWRKSDDAQQHAAAGPSTVPGTPHGRRTAALDRVLHEPFQQQVEHV